MEEGISLSQLQERIKSAVSVYFSEKEWVRAEVHEVKRALSGHCYIELVEKDENSDRFKAKASAVVWASKWKNLSQAFEFATGRSISAGMRILVQVQVQFSELYGLTFVINDIDATYTLGEVELARQRTIARLKQEGMFDMNRLLPVPALPRNFAVISAATAAGYGDFMKHLHENRYGFHFNTLLYNAPMQGNSAPSGIVAALETICSDIENRGYRFDAVLLLRGGGSVSDLACFDDYTLCANIAQFPLPVMVAVGHERDRHICDDVAALSVKTPTALADYILEAFVSEDASIASLASRMALSLGSRFRQGELLLNTLSGRMSQAVSARYRECFHRVDLLEMRLSKANPMNLLAAGYLPVTGTSGRVDSVLSLREGERISITFIDGIAECEVKKIMEK